MSEAKSAVETRVMSEAKSAVETCVRVTTWR